MVINRHQPHPGRHAPVHWYNWYIFCKWIKYFISVTVSPCACLHILILKPCEIIFKMSQKLVLAWVLILVMIGLWSSLSSANPISNSYDYKDSPFNSVENVYNDSQDESAKRSQRFAWAVSKLTDILYKIKIINHHKVILIFFLKL